MKFLKPMSREEFMRDIDMAEQEIADGKCRSADEMFNGLVAFDFKNKKGAKPL